MESLGGAQDGQRRLVGDGAEHGGRVNGDGSAPARDWRREVAG